MSQNHIQFLTRRKQKKKGYTLDYFNCPLAVQETKGQTRKAKSNGPGKVNCPITWPDNSKKKGVAKEVQLEDSNIMPM